MNKEVPELHDFLGAHFHQDWTVEHDTAEQVIDAFLETVDESDLSLIQRDLHRLLSWGKDEQSMRTYLLKELSCYYSYWNEWGSAEIWLRHLASKIDTKI